MVFRTPLKRSTNPLHKPNIWDTYLPYLVFAYREVPQASTGFSPFELLYGRKVKRPLGLVYDTCQHITA
jgi:hypothetical protein